MGVDMTGIFNSDEEIAKTAEYPNIRLFQVKQMTASTPQDDLMQYANDWESWALSNDTNHVKKFSAVCLLTARYMADVLGKNKVGIYTIYIWAKQLIIPNVIVFILI